MEAYGERTSRSYDLFHLGYVNFVFHQMLYMWKRNYWLPIVGDLIDLFDLGCMNLEPKDYSLFKYMYFCWPRCTH